MFKHNEARLEDREQQYFSRSMNFNHFEESFVDEIGYMHKEDTIVSLRKKNNT